MLFSTLVGMGLRWCMRLTRWAVEKNVAECDFFFRCMLGQWSSDSYSRLLVDHCPHIYYRAQDFVQL